MLCQRMWTRLLQPSRPSVPSSSWIGAPPASSVASTISRLDRLEMVFSNKRGADFQLRPPTVVPGGDLAKVMRACCMISNSTATCAELFTLQKTTYLRWYLVVKNGLLLFIYLASILKKLVGGCKEWLVDLSSSQQTIRMTALPWPNTPGHCRGLLSHWSQVRLDAPLFWVSGVSLYHVTSTGWVGKKMEIFLKFCFLTLCSKLVPTSLGFWKHLREQRR